MTVYQDDTNERGRWVQRGLIQVWQPFRRDAATRSRYQALLAERYAAPTWFPTPPPVEDEMTCRRRLAECVAEDGWGQQREGSRSA